MSPTAIPFDSALDPLPSLTAVDSSRQSGNSASLPSISACRSTMALPTLASASAISLKDAKYELHFGLSTGSGGVPSSSFDGVIVFARASSLAIISSNAS